ncbi:NDP-sugar synthase [Hydrogenibacillus sp. N12]|uniref:nucleotidyltransferase family protein n=1 Tax=Hydrogenibacillus sp. N12 TaxID=2866627 RepID=UPI001C7DC2F8|nr:NDP-sugar synthase [Hydrogenibacillus sp. N12]QZA33879.1 NDP-sugar synthase [Hydrogenibacillus sp. N12]
MQALLLAGGLGTRLRPLTDDLPKPMAPLGNRPWLESLIRHLKNEGVSRFVLAVKHFPEVIERHFGDGRRLGVEIVYAREETLLGTAGAIKNAEAFLEERFLVVNADVVHLIDVRPLVRFHDMRRALVTIGLTEVDDPSAYGVVALEEDGRIRRFVEKPRREEAPSNLINAGVYVMEKAALRAIPPGREVSIERETFPALIDAGERIYGARLNGYWMDIGTPERYRVAHWDLLDGRFALPLLPPEAEPGIRLGRRVRLGKGVVLRPPVLIGDGVYIGDGAVVGPYAVIGDGARIGDEAEVVRTILWNGAAVAPSCTVHDSILGDRAETTLGLIIAGAVIKLGRAARSLAAVRPERTEAPVPGKAVARP